MITKEGGCRIIGKYPLERRPSFLRMKNGSTDFGQCRCLYELDLAETATAQIDVVWTLENSGFIQHHHRKKQKTVRNVVRIIVFEEFLQRYF